MSVGAFSSDAVVVSSKTHGGYVSVDGVAFRVRLTLVRMALGFPILSGSS